MTDMSKPYDGGSAFPIPNDDRPGAYRAEPGMSLRDWFAGQAFQAIIRNRGSHFHASKEERTGCCMASARAAYEMADAMIAAREGGAK